MIRSSQGPTSPAPSSDGGEVRGLEAEGATAVGPAVGRERSPGGGSTAPTGSVTVPAEGAGCRTGGGGEAGGWGGVCGATAAGTAAGRNTIRVRPTVTAAGSGTSRPWRWMIGSFWPSTTTGVFALKFSSRRRPSASGSTRSWSRDTDWSPAITQRGISRCGPRPNSSGPEGCSNSVRTAPLVTSIERAMVDSGTVRRAPVGRPSLRGR